MKSPTPRISKRTVPNGAKLSKPRRANAKRPPSPPPPTPGEAGAREGGDGLDTEFPDQENPTYAKEPSAEETARRFTHLSATGVAVEAIAKIERRTHTDPTAVESLVVIAREAIEALHRVCAEERNGTFGPVGLLREMYSTEPFPVLRYPDPTCEAAKAQAQILRDLERGDFSAPKHADNEIDALVRRVWFPVGGKILPPDLSNEEWVRLFVGKLRGLPDGSPEAKLRDEVLNVDSYADKNMRTRRIRTVNKRLNSDIAALGRGDTPNAPSTRGEFEREAERLRKKAAKKIAEIRALPPEDSHHDEAWAKLEKRLLEWGEAHRAAAG
ncbi:MAG: hypothetical protein MUE42_03605 [Opitutaceae bacterium]|jgi:hypothetical protein|nr:hypothetical protein [Opitutaceae bacterium]